ncbi:transposase, partial [Nonomuraea sp. NPDC050153]|uniref:IS1634 family transposase n=1 Tax=Nonomuraea sp. NPDC050153 TaxID=3364359 RepID=UPI0037B876CE
MGFRTFGKSKDSRDDLPQIVIGMAVTRSGIPVRVWSWPGNTSDSKLIRQVKDDMRDWTLSKIVWVADRGFASAENRRYLRKGDHHYIIGEKLRWHRYAHRRAAGRTARQDLCQARPPPLPAHHPTRAATHRRPRDRTRSQPGRQVPAA